MPANEYVILRDMFRTRSRDMFDLPEEVVSPREVQQLTKLTVDVERLGPGSMDRLRGDHRVVSIAPVAPVNLIGQVSVSQLVDAAPRPTHSWGLEAVGATSTNFSGEGVIVAVIDSGIDKVHPAFARRDLEIISADFTGEGEGDPGGHGTHCAGIIFGADVETSKIGGGVETTRIGVARGVRKALIGKVFNSSGESSTATIATAVQWALQNGAHVISMSLGFDFPGMVAQAVANGYPAKVATSRALVDYRMNLRLFEALAALARARAAFGYGAILVAAAGNESDRHAKVPYVLSVSPPAAADGYISVGALGAEGPSIDTLSVAWFSNSDPNVVAPGVDIISAEAGGKGLVAMSGTSMATPHVAGVAALWAERIMQTSLSYSADELLHSVIGRATRVPLDPSVDGRDVGAGVVQAPRDWGESVRPYVQKTEAG